jgi:hypothetical protein
MLFGQNLKGGTPFWVLFKDAGIVYESFRNESSNLGIFFSKTNLRIESLGSRFANLDSQIRQPGFVRIQDSRIWIFKDLFCAIVQRIREDSLDS